MDFPITLVDKTGDQVNYEGTFNPLSYLSLPQTKLSAASVLPVPL
jgi:hypothetical protein